MNVLLHVLACGAYWASRSQSEVFCQSVKRLADGYGDGDSWLGLNLRGYPALLAFYPTGLVSVAQGDHRMLERLLTMMIRVERNKCEKSIIMSLSPCTILRRDLQQQLLPGREREFTPLSNHVFEVLRDPLRDYLPDDNAYDQAFDWFEYLSALVHCDRTITPEQIERANSGATDWCVGGPVGRFLWNRRDSDDSILARTRVGGSEGYPAIVAAILRIGLFRSVSNALNWDHFQLVKQAFDRFVVAQRNAMGVY